MALEIRELAEITKQAEKLNDLGAVSKITKILEQDKNELEILMKQIQLQLTGRLVRANYVDQIVYEVHDYNGANALINLRRVHDQNHILLAKKSAPLKPIQQETLLQNYHILSKAEEILYRKAHLQAKDCKMIIKYQIMKVDEESECLPLDILPKRISLNDYDIGFNKSTCQIEKVSNKDYGAVEFEAIKIDENVTYMLGSTMKVYSTIHRHLIDGKDQVVEMLNIIHIHLNDSSDDASIDVVYLENGKTKDDHLVFKNDATGRPLRYKILCQNMHVHSVLYNTGSSVEEVPFEEHKVKRHDKV